MRVWEYLPLSGFKRMRIAAQGVDSGKMIKCATVQKLRGFLMESMAKGKWMEAKILELRRNRKKEIFDIPLLTRQDFSKKSVLTEKVEKICLFVEGSLSFTEFWWRELGFVQGVFAFC